MDASNVISLLGGVALFLFGMTLMGEGLKKVAGSSLELILFRLSSTPLKGLLLGAGVTGEMLALEIVDTWLNTEFSHAERHQRRIDKVMALENE